MMVDLLGIPTEFTFSSEEFLGYQGPKFSYGPEPVGNELFLRSSGFLYEHSVLPFRPSSGVFGGIPVLFSHNVKHAVLPYDPLAAGFYMVSRYEEYNAEKKDRYGRYPATASAAWENGFLELPVVQYWAGHLGSELQQRFPELIIQKPAFRLLPTIDIDHAYAFLHRPLWRTSAGAFRSLMRGDVAGILRRLRVLLHLDPDPYDVYAYIREIHDKTGIHPLYFILFADYGGKDNNIPVRSNAMKNLVRFLDRDGTVGIHPSLSTARHPRRLTTECEGLGRILQRKITASRQHHLKLELPRTYRQLIKAGITQDYSMGYASHPGFRAGIAFPFMFFDLVRNEVTSLKVMPIAVMDVTLRDHLRLTREQSLHKVFTLMQHVRHTGGDFVTLWHNESLSGQGHWKGWETMYEAILQGTGTAYDQVSPAQ